MHEAYQKSHEEFKETEAKFSISTLNSIHSKLPLDDLPSVGLFINQILLSSFFLRSNIIMKFPPSNVQYLLMKDYIVKLFIFIRKKTKFNYPATHFPISGHWKISFIESNRLKFIKMRM